MRENYDAVMLVMNGILSDSRVVRTARTAYQCGLSVLVVGLGRGTAEGLPMQVAIGGPDAVLVPVPTFLKADARSRGSAERHRRLLRHYEEQVLELCGRMTPRLVHSHDMTTIAAGGRLKEHYAARGHPVRWIHDLHEWVNGLTTIDPQVQVVSAEDEGAWIKRADVLTTVSPQVAEAVAVDHDLEKRPIVVLNTPVLREFDPTYRPTVRETIAMSDGTPLAVYCGQVKEARSTRDLVEALAFIDDLHVAIVSNNRGAYIDSLVETARQAGTIDRLHLLPYVDQREVASYIRTADVGVHTLARYGNGDVALPNKLFEYIHASLPVVVSDCRAMAEFVKDEGVGYTYSAGDVPALADALRQALENRAALGERSASIRAKYSWETQERVLKRLYADVLGVGDISEQPPFKFAAPINGPSGSEKSLRIFHGVAGSANQPWTLAEALRRRGHVAHNVVTAVPRLGFGASLLVPWARLSTDQHFDVVRGLAEEFDVFHFHARSFFFDRTIFRFPTFLDLLLLRLLGKTVVFHFRGTEARLASKFAEHNPYHYVDSDPYGFRGTYPEDLQRLMISFIQALAHAVYVPDPELQGYVAGSEIVPRAVDLTTWHAIAPNRTAARPLVVHAPTRSEIKGTPHVLEAVAALRAEGVDFDFTQVTGMPHADARKLYEQADIIIDQLLIGWYGVLAVEGMALAKPVVTYVRPDLLHHLGTPHPLATADPSNVRDVLRRLLTDPEERFRLGQTGRAYVERVHDAGVVARDLEQRYRALVADAGHRGADYEGIAALFESQATYSRDLTEAVARASRTLGLTESTLAKAAGHAKKAREALGSRASSAAEEHGTPAVRAIVAARKQSAAVHAALKPFTHTAAPASPIGDDPTRASNEPQLDTKSAVDPSHPTSGARPTAAHRRSATNVPTVAEAVGDNRWGIGNLIADVGTRNDVGWDELAHAAMKVPAKASALLRALLAEGDESSHGVARTVAVGVARAFVRDGVNLRVPTGGGSGRPHVTAQVEFARHYYNLRSLLGRDAELIAAALLKPTLSDDDSDGESPNPLRHAEDDDSRTRFNDLCWYFINTAAVSRTLNASTLERYERSLAWFSQRLGLWEVSDFRTTRTTLAFSVPIRLVPVGEDPISVALDVSVLGDASELRTFDRATGKLNWIERTISGRLDHLGPYELHLKAPSPMTVTVSLPDYSYDPRRATPRIGGWRDVKTVDVDRRGIALPLDTLPEIAGRASNLTPFRDRDGHPRNYTLTRQVEQLETLERLHAGHSFGERASVWRGFLDYWAEQPLTEHEAC